LRAHPDSHLHRADVRARGLALAVVSIPVATIFTLRGRHVVSIQAYIFAALSAIYIGSKIERT
jgi:F0F1-type ATP synthase membrane subunit a